eukprot:scaffold308_cov327-Pavlova_lutheri.AAC.29
MMLYPIEDGLRSVQGSWRSPPRRCLLQRELCLQSLAFMEQSIMILLQRCKRRAHATSCAGGAFSMFPRAAQSHGSLSRFAAEEARPLLGCAFIGTNTQLVPFPVLFAYHHAMQERAGLQVSLGELGIFCNNALAELDGIGEDVARPPECSQSHQQGQCQHGVPQGVGCLDRQMFRQGNPDSPQHPQPCQGRGKEPSGLPRGDEHEETESHAVQGEGPGHPGRDPCRGHDGEEGLVQRSRGPLLEGMADFERVVQDSADEQPHGEGQPLSCSPGGLDVPERPRTSRPSPFFLPPRS